VQTRFAVLHRRRRGWVSKIGGRAVVAWLDLEGGRLGVVEACWRLEVGGWLLVGGRWKVFVNVCVWCVPAFYIAEGEN
jgi:hypothetical protein